MPYFNAQFAWIKHELGIFQAVTVMDVSALHQDTFNLTVADVTHEITICQIAITVSNTK